MARPRVHDDDLRLRLVESAARLLGDEGPHAISTRRVAAEVGTSTSAIYHLLGSKQGLVRAMYLEGFGRLAAALEAVPPGPPLPRLAALGDAYFENGLANPHLYRVMFDCPVPEFEATEDDLLFSLSTLQVLIDAVRACVDAGDLHGDAEEIAIEVWAASHGVVMLTITGMLGPVEQAREHARRLGAAIVSGYGRPPA